MPSLDEYLNDKLPKKQKQVSSFLQPLEKTPTRTFQTHLKKIRIFMDENKEPVVATIRDMPVFVAILPEEYVRLKEIEAEHAKAKPSP